MLSIPIKRFVSPKTRVTRFVADQSEGRFDARKWSLESSRVTDGDKLSGHFSWPSESMQYARDTSNASICSPVTPRMLAIALQNFSLVRNRNPEEELFHVVSS